MLENLNAGTDRVYSTAASFTLSSNLEDLLLIGEGNQDGTGNDLDNSLYGSDANNALYGGLGNDLLVGQAGDDQLTGNEGNDRLIGGDGSDVYFFSAQTNGFGQDRIDNQSYDDAADSVAVLGATYDQLWFRQESGGDDLIVSVIGTSQSVTVEDWFQGDSYHVDQFAATQGLFAPIRYLSHNSVQQLVDAMAGMTPPPAGQTTLTDAQRTTLSPVLESAWVTTPVA
ncbi:MAG: calcium-binding protein [Aquabacterium sp.]